MARYFLNTSIYPTVPSMPIEMPYPRVIRVEGDLTPRTRIPSLMDPQDGISLQEALQQVANNTASSNATGEKSNTLLLPPTACDKNHGVAHAPAVSTLHILRGPQAGETFPIPRGTTTLGRASTPYPHTTNLLSKTSGGHLQIRDPFLQPIHGAFHVDSAGIRWAPVDSAETRPLTWNTPFCLGSSLCVLRPPHSAEQSSAHFSLPQADRTKNAGTEPNPFEPVSVTPPPPCKLTHILLSICLPILVGLAIALLTGLWFLLLMSVASSLLMLLHFFGGKAENRAATRLIREATICEEERARALPTAATLALHGPHHTTEFPKRHPALVLGYGPRYPFLRGRHLSPETLPTFQEAPHYLPQPSAQLGHILHLEESQLRNYLIQLLAGYPGPIAILLTDPSSKAQERTQDLLKTLAVAPNTTVYYQPLPGQQSNRSPANDDLECLNTLLQPKTVAQAPPLMVIPEESTRAYASFLRTLPTPSVAAGTPPPSGRTMQSPTGEPVSPALCVIRSDADATSRGEGTPLPDVLAARGWIECVSTGSHRHSIRYSSHRYSPPPIQPMEGVYQVHPLALNGLCVHADGLSLPAFLKALENLYQSSRQATAKRLSTSQVHRSAHPFSSLRAPKATRQPEGTELPPQLQGIDLSAESLRERWEMNRYAEDIRCYVGASAQGPLTLGLSEHGPHWLLGGTTGAGKSQLLRSLVLSAALRYPPERLGLILVDFKGSAGLGPLAHLPHVLSVLSNFDVSSVERALEFLRADIHHRERDLQKVGVNSYRDYLALCRREDMLPCYPELLIVVDEFRMLIDSMPDAMTELMRIATIGRSLGLHLILATQRPQGAISQDIRANIATSICLRVASAQDSYNLLEHEEAAYISATLPGAGYIRLPDGHSLAFRAPLVDEVPSGLREYPVRVYGLEQDGWRLLSTPENHAPAEGGEDEMLTRSIRGLQKSFEAYETSTRAHALPIASAGGENTAHGLRERYCPIPAELPATCQISLPSNELSDGLAITCPDDTEPAGYILGEVEVAQYGIRHRYRWTGELTLGILAQATERAPLLRALIAQAFGAHRKVLLFTSDAGLYREFEPYTRHLEVLVGPQELPHFRFCLEELKVPQPDHEAQRPLILVDGLDGWLEALTRQPDTENLLYDLLAQGHRRGYSILFSSTLSPRGRFGTVAHATLLSRRFLDTDLLRATSRGYPVPSQGHYCVEGRINEQLIGDQPLSASVMAPCAVTAEELRRVLSSPDGQYPSNASTDACPNLRQFPEYYRMPSAEYIHAAHGACNPQSGRLLVGFDRRCLPVWLEAPQGAMIPIPGPRSTGKSTLLRSVHQLNPQLQVLMIEGGNAHTPATVDEVRSLLDSMSHPEKTLLLIDDLQYLSVGVQNLILERHRAFRAVFLTYTPWPRRMSSPLLSALMGCSRALLLAPASLADADICTVTALPLDRYTAGVQPAGRLVAVDGPFVEAVQVPLPRPVNTQDAEEIGGS